MKISELIKHLEDLQNCHGDLDVEAKDDIGSLKTFKETEVYVYNALGIQRDVIIFDYI